MSGPRELSETMERYRKPGTRNKTNVQTYTFVPSWTIATYLAFYSTVNQGMVVEKQSVLSRRSCRPPVVERTSDHHVILPTRNFGKWGVEPISHLFQGPMRCRAAAAHMAISSTDRSFRTKRCCVGSTEYFMQTRNLVCYQPEEPERHPPTGLLELFRLAAGR